MMGAGAIRNTDTRSLQADISWDQIRSDHALTQGWLRSVSRLGRLSGANSRQDWIKLVTWCAFYGVGRQRGTGKGNQKELQ